MIAAVLVGFFDVFIAFGAVLLWLVGCREKLRKEGGSKEKSKRRRKGVVEGAGNIDKEGKEAGRRGEGEGKLKY